MNSKNFLFLPAPRKAEWEKGDVNSSTITYFKKIDKKKVKKKDSIYGNFGIDFKIPTPGIMGDNRNTLPF